MHLDLLPILGLFRDRNDKFTYTPGPLTYFNLWNPYPFKYLKPDIGTPSGRASRKSHNRKYPLGTY